MTERELDVIVVGAGAPGEACAGHLAEGGLAVAVVEQHLAGGECSYYACMPSKALLRPGALLDEVRRVPGVRERVSGGPDPSSVLARRDEVIHDRDDSGQAAWLEERGIELIRGRGVLAGERRVEVGGEALRARRAIVLATGSEAVMPPIEGLESVRAWTNREGTTAGRPPASMLVVGGGPVGVELAQAWASLGTRVTLVGQAPRLLPGEEPFAGEQVAEALRGAHGVEVRTGTSARSLAPAGDGVEAELEDGEAVRAERLLVAAGRRPRTAGIGLEGVGVDLDEDGHPRTDARLRVGGREWLYAIGDVNGRARFTHIGKYQAWVAAENLLGRPVEAEAEAHGPPRVIFTDPQVAAVGRTLEEARRAGAQARAIDVATDATAGASFAGRGTGGTSRLVVDDADGTLVGATFTGFETAELLHAATVAIAARVPLGRLRHAVAAFPTRSEVWLKLLEAGGL